MNSILTAQNEPRQIERLAAMRRLYGDAKFWLAAQMIGVGVGSVGLSLWAAHDPTHPQVSLAGGVWGVALTLADLLWLSPHQKRLKKTASDVQEMFDCHVLQLAPSRKLQPVDPETIARAAQRHAKPKQRDRLLNWYPVGVGVLPLPLARVLCQRANSWWDAGLRERYVKWVGVLVALLVAGVLVYGLFQDFQIEPVAQERASTSGAARGFGRAPDDREQGGRRRQPQTQGAGDETLARSPENSRRLEHPRSAVAPPARRHLGTAR